MSGNFSKAQYHSSSDAVESAALPSPSSPPPAYEETKPERVCLTELRRSELASRQPEPATTEPEGPPHPEQINPLPWLQQYIIPRICRPLEKPTLFETRPDVRDAMALLPQGRLLRVVYTRRHLFMSLRHSVPGMYRHESECHHVHSEGAFGPDRVTKIKMAQVLMDQQERANHEICTPSAQGKHRTEGDVAKAWLAVLAEPVNRLAKDILRYLHWRVPMAEWTAGEDDTIWVARERQSRTSAWSKGLSRQSVPRACLKWSMGSSCKVLESLASDACTLSPQGLMIGVTGGRPYCEGDWKVSTEALCAALLMWSTAHFTKSRWSILFNGEVAIVAFLYKQDEIHISGPIPLDPSLHLEEMPLMQVMLALCWFKTEDAARDLLSDDPSSRDISFYTRVEASAD